MEVIVVRIEARKIGIKCGEVVEIPDPRLAFELRVDPASGSSLVKWEKGDQVDSLGMDPDGVEYYSYRNRVPTLEPMRLKRTSRIEEADGRSIRVDVIETAHDIPTNLVEF